MTTDEMRAAAQEAGKESTIEFMDAMESHGLDVYHYRVRDFYEGPAVKVGFLSEVGWYDGSYQWDRLGKGFVVYPAEWRRDG